MTAVPVRPAPIETAAVVIAVGLWLVFVAVFGFRGFNLREDGYLLALGDRVLRGEIPYRDFAYIRPPLPVWTSALLLALAPHRAVAVAGGYVAAQIATVAGLAFVLVRDAEPSPWRRALYVAAGAVLACTGGFPPAPWHTVDGIFYATLAAALLVGAARRRAPGLAALAGAAAAAAAASKQGFAVVLVAGAALALTGAGRRIGRRPWTGLAAYGLGAGTVAAAIVSYLAWHGAASAAARSVLLDPREITREVLGQGAWELLVGMHLPGARGALAGLAVLGLVALPAARGLRGALGAGLLGWLVATYWASGSAGRVLTLFVIAPAYVLAAGGILGLLLGHVLDRRPRPVAAAWTAVLAAGTLYASVWSYVGIRSSTIALPFLLPVVLAGLAGPVPDGAAPAVRRRAAALVAVGLAALSIAGHVPTWRGYTTPFAIEGLRGIAASPDRVASLEAVIALVRRETRPDEPVLSLVDFPALYFLAGRPNATRVDWLLPQELTRAEAERALDDLRARRPRLAVVTGVTAGAPPHRRVRPIVEHVVARYDPLERVGEFAVYRLRE